MYIENKFENYVTMTKRIDNVRDESKYHTVGHSHFFFIQLTIQNSEGKKRTMPQ